MEEKYCIMDQKVIKKYITSFKKSWVAKTMFSSDISKLVIERNLYDFTINMYTSDNNCIKIPFNYKPQKRKRKSKINSHINIGEKHEIEKVSQLEISELPIENNRWTDTIKDKEQFKKQKLDNNKILNYDLDTH